MQHRTFEKSRVQEYFTEKELSMQMGADAHGWALMLIKELIDNSIDDCESFGIAPEIEIEVGEHYFSVSDNGSGIPFKTVEKSLDYNTRVSSNDAYVRPTRGQLGNALKLIWAAPYVATGKGSIMVSGAGYEHSITVTADPLTNEPNLDHEFSEVETVGTIVKIDWFGVGIAASWEDDPKLSEFILSELCKKYSLFNPHLSLSVKGLWEKDYPATDLTWTTWAANKPGSVWWYSFEKFSSLIKSYLVNDRGSKRETTLREFITLFDGLSSTGKQKKVTQDCDLKNALLTDLMNGGELDDAKVRALFAAMRANAKPITAKRFGGVGKFDGEYACRKIEIIEDDKTLPCVVEAAFEVIEDGDRPTFSYGLNHAVIFDVPNSLVSDLLGESYLSADSKYEDFSIRFTLHIHCPEFKFRDKGKQQMIIPSKMEVAISEVISKVCKKWKKKTGQLKRNEAVSQRQLENYIKSQKPKKTSIKKLAYEVMERAYMKASNDGQLPANARQIMYAARPYILENITADKFDDGYFTQTLLPDFMAEHPKLTRDWKVAYDPRGNFIHPHTGNSIPLGTLAVDSYCDSWHEPKVSLLTSVGVSVQTRGWKGNYQAVLFIEKEGFNALFQQAKIAERFDMAIMSTKGMTTTASRKLLEKLSEAKIPFFFLHDFDKSGMTILHTFRNDTRRYKFKAEPIVHDLGLRLEDVEKLELQSEPVSYGSQEKDPRINLVESGATENEANFLVDEPETVWKRGKCTNNWQGQRVELNALTSKQLIDLIEEKLTAYGLEKLIPDETLITEFYRQNVKSKKINELVQLAAKQIEDDEIYIPSPYALKAAVKKLLNENPSMSWVDAVRMLTEETAA